MIFRLPQWNKTKEFVLFLTIIALAVVWLHESTQIVFLFPFRLVAGLFLAVFPAGFMFLLIFFQEKDAMSKLEWLAYSIALSIAFLSFGTMAYSVIFGGINDSWVYLRIILFFTAIFFFAARIRQFFSEAG